jgi:YHS domain-containing protein
MKMYRIAVILSACAAVAALAGAVAAQEEQPAVSQGSTESGAQLKEMEGTTCPVLGNPIDKKYSYVYKGTIYYFCCPMCIRKFKEDPEKYIGKSRSE